MKKLFLSIFLITGLNSFASQNIKTQWKNDLETVQDSFIFRYRNLPSILLSDYYKKLLPTALVHGSVKRFEYHSLIMTNSSLEAEEIVKAAEKFRIIKSYSPGCLDEYEIVYADSFKSVGKEPCIFDSLQEAGRALVLLCSKKP